MRKSVGKKGLGVPRRRASGSRVAGVPLPKKATAPSSRPSTRSRARALAIMPRKQRHELYKSMLRHSYHDQFNESGLCYLLHKLGHSQEGYDLHFARLPEINKQRPTTIPSYWYPLGEWKERRKMLRKAIALTAPKRTAIAIGTAGAKRRVRNEVKDGTHE